MAKNVNPAMQAAPYLGDSSHNPVEFARRQNMQKFQMQRREYEEQQRNTARGLENLMLDVKGWEDKKGFEVIMSEQQRIADSFIELSRRGMNLTSPKSANEILAYKAIAEAHQRLKEKVDIWNQNKEIYDLYIKGIQKDSMLEENEQTIDKPATMANLQKKLKSEDLLSSTSGLQNLVVTKTKPVDVFKDIEANKNIFEKGTVRQDIVELPDGSKQISSVDDYTPQQIENNAKIAGRLFESKPQSYKDAVKKMKEAEFDDRLRIMSDKDYFQSIAVPPWRKKFLDRPTGSGGGGMSINFGGVRDYKINPGELQTNSNKIGGRNYDQRYDFETTGKLIKVPTAGGYKHDSDEYTDKKTGEYSNGWNEITGGDYAEAELLFYDPKTDELVFRTGQAAENPFIGNNVTFSVPRKNVPKAEGLPIKLPDGKIGTLKDVMGTGTATAKVLPLRQDFWSKPKEEVYLPGSKKAGGKGKFDDL